MIHPLFRLIASQPHMVAEHIGAYSELLSDEVALVAGAWKRKLILTSIALVLFGLAVVWAGVSVLLWAAIPTESMHAPWLLLMMPLAIAIVGALVLLSARTSAAAKAFSAVKAQFAADAAMLREVQAS